MRKYTNFEVVEGIHENVVSIFSKIENALGYIEAHYTIDNIVEQTVQINATNSNGESETYSCFEVYDIVISRISESIPYEDDTDTDTEE